MEQKPEPENKPLSWDEIKDKVVQEYNYDNWQHFENECPGYLTMQSFMDAAAKLFARESFHRGAREQREICASSAKVKTEVVKHPPDPCSYKVQKVDRESIRNAPAPEFKA